ncbi:MAG: CRISPR-associated endonuclease Cas1 [Lachnospiraceae bacterium]|nr:CRISPR-associated endonuclease Cas1 [Lachnospiraceae bacterium]
MSYVYVSEQGAVVSFEANRIKIKYKDGLLKSIPVETVEVIEVFGKVQLTTQCIEMCLSKGITVLYYSTNGAYFGRLSSSNHVNVRRQRIQADLGRDAAFNLAMAKRVINAKIRNQIVVVRRYARSAEMDMKSEIQSMQYTLTKIESVTSIDQLMGYEGYAARVYFSVLAKLVDPEFVFSGRTKRPPMDPFNSLISLGYSIIMNEIYGKIAGRGLNPYFGFMHQDKEKHPTLASDLMEEWRAVLIDTTAMSMLNGHELTVDDFYRDNETGGVYLNKDAFRKYVGKLESKFRTENRYLPYIDYSVSFRKAIDMQVHQYVQAIESGNCEEYRPVIIR